MAMVIGDASLGTGLAGAVYASMDQGLIDEFAGDHDSVFAEGGLYAVANSIAVSVVQHLIDNIDLAAAGGIPADRYCSQTVTSQSNSITSEFAPFDQNNHAGFAATANITDSGVVFTSTNGRFTVPSPAGKFKLDAVLVMAAAGSTPVTIRVKKNGTTIWTSTPFIHSSVDPVERTVALIVESTPGTYFELTIDGVGVGITSEPGCTVNFTELGAGGGGGAVSSPNAVA